MPLRLENLGIQSVIPVAEMYQLMTVKNVEFQASLQTL